jgi:hypothetical protein
MRELSTRLRRKRKPHSRARRIVDWSINVLAMGYLLLLCFPQMVFAHSVSYRHFQVYSDSPISPNVRSILDLANRRLATCEINEPNVVHRIFVCPSHASFDFFSPVSGDCIAVNMSFLHNIFINTADITQNTVETGVANHRLRSLSSVIAHECTHTLLVDRFGDIAMLQQPSWKQEGYCEWVSGTTSFGQSDGMRLLKDGRSVSSPSFFYLLAYTAVSYLENR